MIKNYDKAIRDKIPDIIKKSGNSYNVKKLSDDEFLPELEKKLREEVEEYLESKSVEELADAIEVIYRIAELKGISNEKLEMLREEKANKRGKFNDNLFLIDTTDG
jgi:predicted house-cleaning noncanonical NTP pyrophosphatase (MazG superfamily)